MEWLCGNHCPCCGATHPDVCRGLEMCLAVAEASRHSNVWRRWWGHLSPSCPMFPSSSLPIPSSQEPPLAFRPDGLILTPSVSPASHGWGQASVRNEPSKADTIPLLYGRVSLATMCPMTIHVSECQPFEHQWNVCLAISCISCWLGVGAVYSVTHVCALCPR